MTSEPTVEETVQTNASSDKPESTNQDDGLTVHDLQSMKAIIDVASSRGAFKPSEMLAVGQTYTKLEKFLSSITATESN